MLGLLLVASACGASDTAEPTDLAVDQRSSTGSVSSSGDEGSGDEGSGDEGSGADVTVQQDGGPQAGDARAPVDEAGAGETGNEAGHSAADPAEPAVNDLEAGLIGYYPLDGNSDDATSVTPGSVSGALPAPDRNGIDGAALAFDGGDDFVEFEQAAALNVAQDFSIALWVNATENIGGAWYTLFEKSDPERGGHSRYGLWLHGPRPAACFEAEDNSQQPCVESTQDLPLGEWHHVAAVRNRDRMMLYIDGTEVANGAVGSKNVSQTDFNAYIGNDGYEPGAPWLDATLDELRVYDRALSLAEISELAAP